MNCTISIVLSYAVEPSPNGLAQAFLIDEDDVYLILGDNIFYGHGLVEMLHNLPQKSYSKLR